MLPLREGSLTATVESVLGNEVGLRLEGVSKIGATGDSFRECTHEDSYRCGHWGAELAWLGFVKIDRSRKAVTRFELVGLGETHLPRDRRGGKPDGKVHAVPTGVVVELASDCSANRTGWPPLADARLQGYVNYWDLK